MAVYNDRGEEIPDPTPVALPVGYAHPEPLHLMIERLIDSRLAREVLEVAETEEEANDFDVADDLDITDFGTEYEFVDMEDDSLADRAEGVGEVSQSVESIGSGQQGNSDAEPSETTK